jgi:hypothetical protein
MNEKSCSTLATMMRVVVRARARNAVLPHHHYARRGQMLHEKQNL